MFAMIESNSNKFYSQIHVVLNHSPKAQGGAMAADKPQGLSRQDIDQYIAVSLSHPMSRTLLCHGIVDRVIIHECWWLKNVQRESPSGGEGQRRS
jgi:hypothetical protein